MKVFQKTKKKAKTIRRKLVKRVKNIKNSFKRKRRAKKEKKKKKRFFAFWSPCCVLPIIIMLGLGLFFVGDNIDWFNGEEGAELGIPWVRPVVPAPDDGGVFEDEEEDIYYQLGLEFPIRNEDIDVLMIVEVNTSDHLTFIESFGLASIGLCVSANDYKPADVFFLYMFYGDAEYNITFSTVVTVGEGQDITVYMNGVAIDEIINVTWIADGSGVRWDYP